MWSVKIDLTADQPVNFVFNFPNNFIVAVSVFLTASKKNAYSVDAQQQKNRNLIFFFNH